jgi:hypothetical protein
MLTPRLDYRATKSDASRFKLMLRVEYVPNTTCLWQLRAPRQPRIGVQIDPATLPIPCWLADRFILWHAACLDIETFDYRTEGHQEMRRAYGLSLAMDLSYFLGDDIYYVEFDGIQVGWPRFTFPAGARVPFREFWREHTDDAILVDDSRLRIQLGQGVRIDSDYGIANSRPVEHPRRSE